MLLREGSAALETGVAPSPSPVLTLPVDRSYHPRLSKKAPDNMHAGLGASTARYVF